jgi:hypothetical protein
LTWAWAAAALLALAACPARTQGREVPAVITHPSAQSRAELARVVSDALKGAPVTLAEDALTRESSLMVERARPRDARGVPLDGRERGRPEHFLLVTSDARCLLVHEGSGRRWTLGSTTCAPARKD